MTDTVLIIDFGSQVTQLIARRVREQGVYSEIVPFNKAEEALERLKPKAVILSGGPASVTEFGTPRAPDWVFKAGLPVLGICYGEQTMVAQLGGGVEGGHHREFGRAEIEVTGDTALFDGVWKKGERDTVWMSHGDRVTQLPPGFKVVGVSKGAPFAAIADEKRKLYAVQFHPEVAHTPARQPADRQLRAPASPACRATGAWRTSGPARSPRSAPRSARAASSAACRAASTARWRRC